MGGIRENGASDVDGIGGPEVMNQATIKEAKKQRGRVTLESKKGGYDHIVKGLMWGDSLYLVDENDVPLLRFDWNPVNGRFVITLPVSHRYSIHPGHEIELPK